MAYTQQSDWDAATLKRRTIGVAATLIIKALLILAFLSLTLQSAGPNEKRRGFTAFNLGAETEAPAADDAAAATAKPLPRNAVPETVAEIPKPLLPSANPLRTPPPSPDFIKVSKADFDAMDLSKIPSNGTKSSPGSGQGSDKGSAKESGSGSKGMIGPGAGPGGAQLYPVAWYREPYDSELAPYLAAAKAAPAGASAEIACRMIENYHVENCQIITENPRGTGLAKALRLAAWQFLVRPPRVDNKPQLGVWVRIRFDFRAAKAVGDDTSD
jgi:hypothetical protein